MIFAAAARYPGKVALALTALVVTAAATLAIPSGFRLIIDRGFATGVDPAEIGRWFRYLFAIVLVLALGTAARFYFVSWLGERVVAGDHTGGSRLPDEALEGCEHLLTTKRQPPADPDLASHAQGCGRGDGSTRNDRSGEVPTYRLGQPL